MEEASKEKPVGDQYRSYLVGEEGDDTHWRLGSPPTYDLVNKLFEEGRTKVWPKGSLEEKVQNAIKTWEMEFSHKTRLEDFKTINREKFKFIVNGRQALSAEETLKLGSYNALLQNSQPEEDLESFESSHELFRTAFPRGFAWEVLHVYSGPPVIVLKFRHWGYMEGPYKGHAPTGEKVEFYGMAILKVDEHLRAEELEIYYDPAELIGGFLKGPLLSPSEHLQVAATSGEVAATGSSSGAATSRACPYFKG
ncbi:pathogen-related protein [Phoenix dactylifera]|uniref:Pathogen-related protein n=1 Tax=Phoenix dactylifera TaxID=42345 RepID=A0A8B7C5W9_PHODC|nr:pathogen-related protein [Phoenix dactylifera]